MPWLFPPESDDLNLDVSFAYVKIQQADRTPPVPAMTFSQVLALFNHLYSQVESDTPATQVLERCIDVFTKQNN